MVLDINPNEYKHFPQEKEDKRGRPKGVRDKKKRKSHLRRSIDYPDIFFEKKEGDST